jgi:hypothetical protein
MKIHIRNLDKVSSTLSCIGFIIIDFEHTYSKSEVRMIDAPAKCCTIKYILHVSVTLLV